MPAFAIRHALRLFSALGCGLLLSSCGLVNSAGGAAQAAGELLMSPLRMLNGTLRADATAPGAAVSEDELLKRANDIQRRGDYPGRPGKNLSEFAAPEMASVQP